MRVSPSHAGNVTSGSYLPEGTLPGEPFSVRFMQSARPRGCHESSQAPGGRRASWSTWDGVPQVD